MIDGRQDTQPMTARTLVLHAAGWDLPHVPGTRAMSYTDAQDEGFHDFCDHHRFICLPVQYPSMAPQESTRWLMLRDLAQCLERGAAVLVLVPPASKAPAPEVADDEPFNSTRQLLREITGGVKGAVLDELPARRRQRVTVTNQAPPHLKEHLTRHTPHFLTQFEDPDRIVLAECGSTHARPAVLIAHAGAGVWSAIPWTRGAPAEAEMSRLAWMLDEVAHMASKHRELKSIPEDIWGAGLGAALPNRFIRSGRIWEIAYLGNSFQLEHVEGLTALAQLIKAAGAALNPFEVLGREAPRQNSGDPSCDRMTKTQLKAAKEVLETKIESVKHNTTVNELERQSALEELGAELSKLGEYEREATGPRGRSRTLDRRWKRAQDALRKRLQTALEKIGEKSPALRDHLDQALRTGHYRAYLPAGEPPTWEIRI